MERILSDFFTTNKGSSGPVESSAGINDISRISESTYVKGTLNSAGDIRIDGKVEGDVSSKNRVVIGENAEIKGTVNCSFLDIWGVVDGEIIVKEVLSLKNTAKVFGNISVRKFQVELGAEVNGSIKMIEDGETQPS